MRRSMLWLLVAPVVACTGYERPVVRNLDATGAPAAQPYAQSWTTPALAAADVAVTHGRVEARAFDSLVIEEEDGEAVQLMIGNRTRIVSAGKPVNVWSVPEGAEVRASWDKTADPPVADQIEVLDLRPE